MAYNKKRLTKKLLEVLCYHPDLTNEEIADTLHITELGVKSRIKRINRILGTDSRAGAQMTAMQAGFISLQQVQPPMPPVGIPTPHTILNTKQTQADIATPAWYAPKLL